jgi:coenzyme F420-reducing hydrogenase beta subunit/polysaccharide pyruvyl transferase WcaK-like protein
MEKVNVTKTRQLGLCLSCELCMVVCPARAIVMEHKFGQFLPRVNEENCAKCGLCLDVCPGIDLDPSNLGCEKDPNEVFLGTCLECYTAHSKNLSIRQKSSSGGLVTTLVTELIKNKEFDVAFVLDFDNFNGKPARLKATNDNNEIIKSAKSKYIPASVHDVIKTLQKEPGKKYVIVGTPCQIYGIKKFINKFENSEVTLLFLGLFCAKTMNFNVIQYFEDKFRKQNEKLVKIEYRTKDKGGWPGHTKLVFDSGRKLIVDRSVRLGLKKFFQLNRCLFCLDKMNRFADISFGDCYIEGKGSFHGKSSVIVRTVEGKQIFQRYSKLFTVERENWKKIAESQNPADIRENLSYAKLFIKKHGLSPEAELGYETNAEVSKKLSRAQKYVRWGMNYDVRKIRFNLLSSRIRSKLGVVEKAVRYGVTLLPIIGKDMFIHHTGQTEKESTGKNIIIVGGQLFNKGAQAMIFTVVDQLKRKFPDKTIYLLSTPDFNRTEEEKAKYNFKILPWNSISFVGFKHEIFLKHLKYNYMEDTIREVLRNAAFFIDISGYALSSQWNLRGNLRYLFNIATAKKYSVPYYIFPQSIGPFNYPLKLRVFLYPLLNVYLQYPKKIFVRENEGVNSVRKITENVEKSYDIVLQNKNYNINNLYRDNIHLKDIKIQHSSVGIIPNSKVLDRAGSNEFYALYVQLINRLIDSEKNVYIVRHSYEDLEICEKIKSFFADHKNVTLISDDLTALELENIVSQFDFVIASRYHSIIHAYKNGVPALVIGWATKYFELLESFGQLGYFFDVRKGIDAKKMSNKLNKMILNYEDERKKIANKTAHIQSKENIFNLFDTGLTKKLPIAA